MKNAIRERGIQVLHSEAQAILALAERLGEAFERAVESILNCEGRLVTTGIGKAGAIARKSAATLSSTGAPAHFMHPADALHGDLGAVTERDLVLLFSYSGESEEVVRLLPSLRQIGCQTIALVGRPDSSIARAAGMVLDVAVEREACPLGLAPTTSTAAMLALSDALALAAMEARGFGPEDFARSHPAGALGRKLTLRVSDVMRTGDQMALVTDEQTLRDALFAITRAGAGCAFVTDSRGCLVGIVTDGDVRRAILRDAALLDRPVTEVMVRDPLTIDGNPLAVEALALLEEAYAPGIGAVRRIGDAPVVDSDGRPVGLLMLKDLVRSGVV